jgi:predicted transcriptional regulator
MPRRWTWYDRMSGPQSDSLSKLLGGLEVEIMEHMWQRSAQGQQGEATVRDIATTIQGNRPVAYTTVMTVMAHLAEKGLLTRTSLDKKTHLYRVTMSKKQFLAHSSQQVIDTLIQDFGELALAQFLEALEQIDPQRLEQLRVRRGESGTEPHISEATQLGSTVLRLEQS